jgi:allantoicase
MNMYQEECMKCGQSVEISIILIDDSYYHGNYPESGELGSFSDVVCAKCCKTHQW